MLRSENGRLATRVYIDGRDRVLTEVVGDLQRLVAAKVTLPPGISKAYHGPLEFLERGTPRLCFRCSLIQRLYTDTPPKPSW